MVFYTFSYAFFNKDWSHDLHFRPTQIKSKLASNIIYIYIIYIYIFAFLAYTSDSDPSNHHECVGQEETDYFKKDFVENIDNKCTCHAKSHALDKKNENLQTADKNDNFYAT